MKTFNRILFVFLSAGAAAIFAIIEGNAILAWMITMCIVGYAVWLAFHIIDSRFAAVLEGIVTLLVVAKNNALMNLAELEGVYTEADLVKFGKYLLSEQREQSIENKENLREVTDADIANAFEK